MKKIIAMLTALVMAASMAACGSTDESAPGTSPAAETTKQTAASEESSPEKTESSEAAETTAQTSKAPEAVTEEMTDMPAENGTNMISGGWALPDGDMSIEKNPEAKAAIEKALGVITGADYEPLALLGTQVVAGTNYCILCRVTYVVPDAQPGMQLVYVYEDLSGNAEITGMKELIGEQLCGGFTAADGDISIDKNPDVKAAFEKAMETITGMSYEPVAYLGSQVVAGTNYLILCKATATIPHADTNISLVTVYHDLQGNSEAIEMNDITLGETDNPAEEGGEETAPSENETEIVGMANPWSECNVAEEAGKAAGFDFRAPAKLGDNNVCHIQAMKGIAEIRYGTEESNICFRKGIGDISGDYNTYEEKEDAKIDGVNVTLLGNGGRVHNASWSDGKYDYSYFARDGVASAEAKEHISALIAANK